MALNRRRLSALGRLLLPGVLVAIAGCSLVVPAPEIACNYLDRDDCERAIDVALTVIGRDRASLTGG